MTKGELIKMLADYPDDTVLEVCKDSLWYEIVDVEKPNEFGHGLIYIEDPTMG